MALPMPNSSARPWPRTARGFTYLGLLFALALIGLALGAAGTVWSAAARRDKEQELLWRGGEIRRAIARYYQAGGGLRMFPKTLEDLLEDRRGPVMLRHLRRVYADPMTGSADWELLRTASGELIGVASRSTVEPLKKRGFSPTDTGFDDAACYCDWRFVYLPQLYQESLAAPQRVDSYQPQSQSQPLPRLPQR